MSLYMSCRSTTRSLEGLDSILLVRGPQRTCTRRDYRDVYFAIGGAAPRAYLPLQPTVPEYPGEHQVPRIQVVDCITQGRGVREPVRTTVSLRLRLLDECFKTGVDGSHSRIQAHLHHTTVEDARHSIET